MDFASMRRLKEFGPIEAAALDAVAAADPASELRRVGKLFVRACLRHPVRWRSERPALSRALRTVCGMHVLLGQFDLAARLLANPIVFAAVRPSDTKWLEILKPIIDRASRRRVGALLPLLWVASTRSPYAAALLRRASLRFRRPAPGTAIDIAGLADELSLAAFPVAFETEALRWKASNAALPSPTALATASAARG